MRMICHSTKFATKLFDPDIDPDCGRTREQLILPNAKILISANPVLRSGFGGFFRGFI